MKTTIGLVAVLLMLAPTACGRLKADTANATASPSSSLVVCPPAAEPAPTGCVEMPSWEEKHADNEAYRQRLPVSEDTSVLLEKVADRLQGELDELREQDHFDTAAVEQAVRAAAPEGAGVEIRPVEARSGTVFAIDMSGGCVTGYHDTRDSEVETGGYVMDGGCLNAPS